MDDIKYRNLPNGYRDELYDKALEITLSAGAVTHGLLQRGLRIGFFRASQLINQLEADGIVTVNKDKGIREVTIK